MPGVSGRRVRAVGLVILVGACSSSRETAGTGSAEFTVHVELASQVNRRRYQRRRPSSIKRRLR